MKRHESLLGALAEAPHESFCDIHVSNIQRNQLADAHAGGVEQLDHGVIA